MNEIDEESPLPDDFCNYVPWACAQLGITAVIVINRILQSENVNALTERAKKTKSRIKLTQSTYNIASDEVSVEDSQDGTKNEKININAIYNNSNNLVEIKFERNKKIPRQILKVIRLIVSFHVYLNRIHIIGGFDKYTLHELNTIIKVSHITEICMDNSFVSEGNYSILLAGNPLRYLSLSRCNINDKVVEEICENLEYPKQASDTLIVLNLSINCITDAGAKFLAEMLRSNRKLSYLNLAGNRITDDGADHIFDTLTEFQLKDKELLAARSRKIVYVKEKMNLIKQVTEELISGELEKKSPRKSLVAKKPLKSTPRKSLDVSKPNLHAMDDLYNTAVAEVEERLGKYEDPFSPLNLVIKEGIWYCKGNNALLYISLAYNFLTYISMKKVLNVLMCQKLLDRKPTGLLNVSFEGNYLPVTCIEMQQLDELIEDNNSVVGRRTPSFKKKPHSKTVSR